MAFGVGGFEVGDGQFRVMFEGVERLVAEEFLDMIHAGPAAKHLSSAASPERVRRDRDGQPGLARMPLDHPAELMVREALPVCVQEQRLLCLVLTAVGIVGLRRELPAAAFARALAAFPRLHGAPPSGAEHGGNGTGGKNGT